MRKILQYSLRLIISLCLGLSLVACQSKVKETLTLGEWIETMMTQLSIEYTGNELPYFINVGKDSPYYQSVQSAVNWGVLTTDVPFDPELSLTKEWVAATLVNLAELEPVQANFNDANKSQFAQHVQTSINFGLFNLDKRGCFNPKDIIEKEEALNLLNKTITYLDTKDNQEVSDIQFKEDIPVKRITPLQMDEGENKAIVKESDALQPNDIVRIENEEGESSLYQVDSVNETQYPQSEEVVQEITYGPIDYFEVVEEGEIVYDEEIPFDDAIIEFDDDQSITAVSKSSNTPKTHQKTFGGFTVKTRFSTSNVTVNVRKKLSDETVVQGNFKLYNFKPIVIWKTSNGKIEHAKFELRFDSVQSASLKYTPYQLIKAADLKDMNKDNFIEKLTSNYKKVGSLAETLIPVCTIQLPLPNAPSITIALQIYLRIGANGKVEFKIANDHSLGFEIKNNSMRLISDHDHDVDFTMSGNAYASAGVKAALKAFEMYLMDVGCDGGVRGNASLIVHLYDDNLNHTQTKLEDMNGDIASELSSQVDDVLTCIDLKAYYTLTMMINSRNTILNKLGFRKRVELLNAKNAPLIPGLVMHLEDGVQVDHCTRGSKLIHRVDKDPLVNYEKITLKKYSYVLDKGSQLQLEIKGIPNDITFSDLRYTSSETTVARVNDKGIITAVNEGACHIVISDKDKLYETTINIVVRMSV